MAAPAQHSTDVTAEVPSTLQQLRPTLRKASRSRGDTSPGSNDRGNAARISKLESRLDAVEKWVDELNGKLQLLNM
jgi:TolA-binding protein